MNKSDEVKYKAYRFSIKIIKFSSTLPNKRVYWIISDQLVRSATSIGANIIEAQAASSRKDFIQFFHIALKSANETRYWLGLLRDATEVEKDIINDFINEAKELCNILTASLLTLKKK